METYKFLSDDFKTLLIPLSGNIPKKNINISIQEELYLEYM